MEKFAEKVKERIKDYLPSGFADAAVEVHGVRKSNGRNLTGLCVRNSLEMGVGTVYLDGYLEEEESGRPFGDVMKDIAAAVMAASRVDQSPFEAFSEGVRDYAKARPNLAVRLVDYERSRDFLEDLPYTRFGPYAVTYRIQIPCAGGEMISSAVINNGLLESWGITLEELHEDALAAEEIARPAVFTDNTPDIPGLPLSARGNLFEKDGPVAVKLPMYVLTTGQGTNGASVIVRDGILGRVGDILGESFFFLPSSIHEFLVVPESMTEMTLPAFNVMVGALNDSGAVVDTDDILSDKAGYYDRESGRCVFAS